MPLAIRGIERQGFAADRLHGDDTTVPVLAKDKTDTGQCWVYVRDDRPFGGAAPPGGNVLLLARSSRRAHLATYAGIFQADAYDGYAGPMPAALSSPWRIWPRAPVARRKAKRRRPWKRSDASMPCPTHRVRIQMCTLRGRGCL